MTTRHSLISNVKMYVQQSLVISAFTLKQPIMNEYVFDNKYKHRTHCALGIEVPVLVTTLVCVRLYTSQ